MRAWEEQQKGSFDKPETTTYGTVNSQNITPQSSNQPYSLNNSFPMNSSLEQPLMRVKPQPQQPYLQPNAQPLQASNSRNMMNAPESSYSYTDQQSDDQYYMRQDEVQKRVKHNPPPQDEKNVFDKIKKALVEQMNELKSKNYGYKQEPSEGGAYNLCFFKSKFYASDSDNLIIIRFKTRLDCESDCSDVIGTSEDKS